MAVAEFKNTGFSETSDFAAVVQRTESLSLEGPSPHSETYIQTVNSSGGRRLGSHSIRRKSLPRTPPVRRETNTTPTAADEVHISDSDEDIELEKLEFAVKRSNNGDYTLSRRRGIPPAITGDTARDKIHWIYRLMQVQHNQENFKDALGTIQSFETELKGGGSAFANVKFENWQALFYYRLGDLGVAKRSCKKAFKYGREDTTYPDSRRKTIELMIHIVKDQGDQLELEFYREMLAANNESASRIQTVEPSEETRTESPQNRQPDTRSSSAGAPSVATQTLRHVPQNHSSSEKERWLAFWGLTLLHDGSISGTDVQIDAVVEHALSKVSLDLASILFADKRILNWGTGIERDYPKRVPPLFWAVSADSPSRVRFLLDRGADKHYTDKNGGSILCLALTRTQGTSVLNLLLNNGCPPDGTTELNTYNGPPLHYICVRHWLDPDQEKISALLLAGADPNLGAPVAGNTALMYLTKARQNSKNILTDEKYWIILKLLVGAGANVNAVDANGNSALHYAYNLQDNFTITALRSCLALHLRNIFGNLPVDCSGRHAHARSYNHLY
ncbi:hypothetical protein H072_3885 [Dactylellina haptotyla CBS 200.50]|uniref:Uncharacterized protein n=1 Tax=Dactylellina haptotyla (strain CBS 200.50) TaxID=1284197 RepID=S8C3D7_DACHA|nr:hypothetical protein H072_3885 [Dactylellina haptotyla CBS 200.50]